MPSAQLLQEEVMNFIQQLIITHGQPHRQFLLVQPVYITRPTYRMLQVASQVVGILATRLVQLLQAHLQSAITIVVKIRFQLLWRATAFHQPTP